MVFITCQVYYSSSYFKQCDVFLFLEEFWEVILLDPPKSRGVIGKDAYKFLIDCQEKLHYLRSLESYRVAYTTYQVTDVARHWSRFLCNYTGTGFAYHDPIYKSWWRLLNPPVGKTNRNPDNEQRANFLKRMKISNSILIIRTRK